MKGAQLLADLVRERGEEEAAVTPPEIAEDAPPLFRWVGVAPQGGGADA